MHRYWTSTLLQSGIRSIHDLGSEAELSGIILAYTESINFVCYFGTVFAGLAFVVSWSLGWTGIRRKQAGKDIKNSNTITKAQIASSSL